MPISVGCKVTDRLSRIAEIPLSAASDRLLLLANVALITVSACEVAGAAVRRDHRAGAAGPSAGQAVGVNTARRKAVCLKPEPAAPAETRHTA
jgi:hypothetical protein